MRIGAKSYVHPIFFLRTKPIGDFMQTIIP